MANTGFDDWLTTAQGQYVLDWEMAKFDLLVTDIFGYNAVQLGLSQHDFLRANRMPSKFHCTHPFPAGAGSAQVQLLAQAAFLPLATASVDLVLLPHVLEFHDAPHQVLREVERILVPEGSVIISGFNPYSLWGWRRRFTCASQASAPWRGQYLSVGRLKDWFALLGLEAQAGSFGCYAPPFSEANHLRRWHFMELAGNRWWPYGGATYIIHAIKRVHGMRLILPGWRERVTKARAIALAGQGKPQPVPHSPHQTKTHDSC